MADDVIAQNVSSDQIYEYAKKRLKDPDLTDRQREYYSQFVKNHEAAMKSRERRKLWTGLAVAAGISIPAAAILYMRHKLKSKVIPRVLDAVANTEHISERSARSMVDNRGISYVTDRPHPLQSFYTPMGHEIHSSSGRVPKSIIQHEIGHGTDPLTLGELLKAKLDGYIMPFRRLKNNKVYKEELRAWDNARRIYGHVDEELADSALGTYRWSIRNRQVTIASSLLGAGIIGSRILRNRKAKAQEAKKNHLLGTLVRNDMDAEKQKEQEEQDLPKAASAG